MKDLEYKVAKLELGSDDVLVVKVDAILSGETSHRLHDAIRNITGHKKVLVLGQEFNLSVLTRAQIEARV